MVSLTAEAVVPVSLRSRLLVVAFVVAFTRLPLVLVGPRNLVMVAAGAQGREFGRK